MFGSVMLGINRQADVFPDSLSPFNARIGYGPVGQNAVTIQAQTSVRAGSSETLTRRRKRSSASGSRSGSGSARNPAERINGASVSSMMRHPSALTSIARHAGSPRSITSAPLHSTLRTFGASMRPPVARASTLGTVSRHVESEIAFGTGSPLISRMFLCP